MKRSFVLVLTLLLPAATLADEVELPCQQHFSPILTAATYWEDAAQLEGLPDWRADKKVAALVMKISPRDVPEDEARAQVAAFRKISRNKKTLPLLFSGLVDETNKQRDEVIGKIRDMGERQINLSHTIEKVNNELAATPEDQAAKRDEIQRRRGFLVRDYDSLDRTLRYACQIPVDLEGRLGALGRALQEGN